MAATNARLHRRFLAVARPFFQSEMRWHALALLALLLVFILGLNGLNVLGSFLCRDFTTAIDDRKAERALTCALMWAGIFGLLTVLAVFKAFTEERMRLAWRQWLTRHLFDRYLTGRAYHRLRGHAFIDNPDQRITEDVRTFTEQTLAIFLILTNSTITLLSFAGILWSITPWLLYAAVAYAGFGSLTTVLLGKRLVKLDVQQYRKEADLRYDLIQVRTQAESIALLGGEPEEEQRLGDRLRSVVDNMKGIIGLSRNIGFFTTGFDYLTQLIPLAIVAPLVISRQLEFGMLLQAQIAFLLVMGAFSIIVKEFQRISTFGAVIERLGVFCEALDGDPPPVSGPDSSPASPSGSAKGPIEIVEDASRIAFENLTLVTPGEGRLLVKDLCLEVAAGERLLILGGRGTGRTSIVRAAAGLWTAGQGRIVRPPLDQVFFLPQQPYLRPGSLRTQLLYGTRRRKVLDHQLLAVLAEVGFEDILERVGGLDAQADWPSVLSAGDQQLLAGARLLLAHPRFAFLDEAASALEEEKAHRLYEALARSPVSYVSVASWPGLRDYHGKVIKLGEGGQWSAEPVPLLASA